MKEQSKKEGMAFSENQQSSMDAFEMHPLDVNSYVHYRLT